MWVPLVFVLLPLLLILNKVFKKMRAIENALGNFFFNGPLRTVEEMYFEMVIEVIINTKFIKFRNKS